MIEQFLAIGAQFLTAQEETRKEFEQRAEEARKKYWDACKYPRKKKKQMRKEAKEDFELYYWLSQPIDFSW